MLHSFDWGVKESLANSSMMDCIGLDGVWLAPAGCTDDSQERSKPLIVEKLGSECLRCVLQPLTCNSW